MASAQFYTNTKLLMDALGLPGDEKGLRARCREASKHLESVIGQFVPVTASKSYDNPGGDAHNGFEFMLDPLLAVVSITDKNGNAISSDDYELYPLNRAWENGPYLRLKTYYDEITINGRWGLYEEWLANGLSGTLAAASTTSLVVTNGGRLWPGKVVKLEDEQILVAAGCGGENSPDPTTATSVTTGYATEATDIIPVTSGAEFYFDEVIRIGDEDMLILRKDGNELIVRRGWNGTLRDEHSLSSAIKVYRTVTIERGANGTTAAAHSSAAMYEAQIPADLAYLATQISSLMRGKAATGFTGRAGNSETGESFWLNEFPRGPIKAIRANYCWRP